MTFEQWGDWFAAQGPGVGEAMIDAELYTLHGDKTRLSSAWREGPAIICTASLTCPVARHSIPELDVRIRQAEDRRPISEQTSGGQPARVVVYCREAHPVGSPAPHGNGGEWITPANEASGILHRQPSSIEERISLARRLHDWLLPSWQFLVDGMDNRVYETFGTASCMAIVVDRQGVIRSKQGWLDPEEALRHALILLQS